MTVEIISRSISVKVWDWAGPFATPESAVRLPTDCATWPGAHIKSKVESIPEFVSLQ